MPTNCGTRATATGATGKAPDTPQPKYPTVETWVTEWFAQIIRRPRLKGWRWCPQWWQHPEAVARLEALWRSWETLRLDGTTGMSVWWRDHCDPHLGALTDQDRSPFKQCSEDKGHVGQDEPLPVEPAPLGWWGTTTQALPHRDDRDAEEDGANDEPGSKAVPRHTGETRP